MDPSGRGKNKMKNNMLNAKFIFPEPLFSTDLLSFSSFLYFHENDIYSTLHPTVSIALTGCNPFDFIKLVEEKKPDWFEDFSNIFTSYLHSTLSINKTLESMSLLRNNGFGTILLSYSRTRESLDNIMALLNSSAFSDDELYQMIDVPMANQEFISHVLFEQYLQFYGDNSKTQKKVDYIDLYNYLDKLIKFYSIKKLLTACYFFRMDFGRNNNSILLTNPRILPFFSNIPTNIIKQIDHYEQNDLFAWEIFRQITSKYLDVKPIKKRINLVLNFNKKRVNEVDSLINKCKLLAEQYKGEKDLTRLVPNISQHVKVNIEKELYDLLHIKRIDFNNLVGDMFSDYKTWASIGGAILSYYTDNTIITAGAGLSVLSNIGSATVKNAIQNKKKIDSSSYKLIYRMK